MDHSLTFFFFMSNHAYLVWGLVVFVQFSLFLPIVLRSTCTSTSLKADTRTILRAATLHRVSLVKQHFTLWLSLVVGITLNVTTLIGVYAMHGAVIVSPLGFSWTVTLSSLILTILVNVILLWYLFLTMCLGPSPAPSPSSSFYVLPPTFFADEYFLLFLFHLLSLFIFGCRDLGTLFIGVEIASFIFILLTGVPVVNGVAARLVVNHGVHSVLARVAEACLTYLLTGLLSALPFLVGILLIYCGAGTLAFDSLLPLVVWDGMFSVDSLTIFGSCVLVKLGGFLIVISFLFKLGAAPLHEWLVRVYAGAFERTVFLLATLSKFFYSAILVRFIVPLLPSGMGASLFFIVVGLFSVFVACYWGSQDLRFRFFLAYSGILNVGLFLLPLGLPQSFFGSVLALCIMWVYTFLIMCFISLVTWGSGRRNIFYGAALTNRVVFRVFTSLSPLGRILYVLVIFALIGLPPLLGFYPKLTLVMSYVVYVSPLLGFWFTVLVVLSSFMYLRLMIGVFVPLLASYSWSTFFFGLMHDLLRWRLVILGGLICLLLLFPNSGLSFIISWAVCVLHPETGGLEGDFADIGQYENIEAVMLATLSCSSSFGGAGGFF